MSEYRRTLQRLRGTDPDSALVEGVVDLESRPPRPQAYRSLATDLPTVHRSAALARLLDNLRALATEPNFPCVVLAGVTHAEDVETLANALLNQARIRGLRVLLVHLEATREARALSAREVQPGSDAEGYHEPQQLPPRELSGPRFGEIVRTWVSFGEKSCDLVLIEAPPLLTSVDAAMVGRACDGLFLVTQAAATPRRQVPLAVERAHSAGCEVSGIVVTETQDWIPRWLQRLLPASF